MHAQKTIIIIPVCQSLCAFFGIVTDGAATVGGVWYSDIDPEMKQIRQMRKKFTFKMTLF
mgnify:CR=1 FL=1